MTETEAGELRLMFEPDDFRFKIDATALRHMAIEKGYGELDFDENALAVAAQHVAKTRPLSPPLPSAAMPNIGCTCRPTAWWRSCR